ncbi:MAG: DUF3558 domain-containing protein [Armatimonadetes bacterium]|nr:MAG: DUF3558 domain-containing protein [Armatimonadota bacterium]
MKRLTAIALALVLSAAACGGSDTSDTPTTAAPQNGTTTSPPASDTTATVAPSPDNEVSLDDPCAIVDDESISATLGKGVTGEKLGQGLCAYVPTDGTGGVELLIQDVSAVGCDVVFSAGGFNDEELADGVGTYARYMAEGAGGTHQIAVCFDEQYSLVAVLYADTAAVKETLIGIADAVEFGLGY